MDYDEPARRAGGLREKGIHRGIGLCDLHRADQPEPDFYGVGGARISAQDGCTVRLDATGAIVAATGVTEQGQGTESHHRRRSSPTALGVAIERVRVITGDTDNDALRRRHLGLARRRHRRRGGAAGRHGAAAKRAEVAGAMLQATPELDIVDGTIVDAADGRSAHAARRARPHRLLPRRHAARPTCSAELIVTRHYVPRQGPSPSPTACRRARSRSTPTPASSSCSTTGASRTAADHQPDAGRRAGARRHRAGHRRRLLRALHLRRTGQLLNGTMADYLVPMAAEMPDIEVGHVETPTADSDSAPRARARPARAARRPRS